MKLLRYFKARGKVGVAFGGGGARGLAHIGVLRELWRYPLLRPDFVSGTSAGSISAAMYAAGVRTEKMLAVSEHLDWFSSVVSAKDLWKVTSRGKGGLIENSKLGNFINELISGKTFRDLDTDLAITATDIQNRTRVIFTSPETARRIKHRVLDEFLPRPGGMMPGCRTRIVTDVDDIGLAVRASCAIPGVFSQVPVKDMKLLDGGITDQVPTSILRACGMDIVIGVSLGLAFMPLKVDNFISAMGSAFGLLAIHMLRKSLELADIGFQVPGIDSRSPVKAGQTDLIPLGENATRAALREYFSSPVLRMMKQKD